jgi:hypothetical protein
VPPDWGICAEEDEDVVQEAADEAVEIYDVDVSDTRHCTRVG